MSITTKAAIEDGYYGIKKYDPKSKTYKFIPLGKAIILEKVLVRIEDGEVFWKLSPSL